MIKAQAITPGIGVLGKDVWEEKVIQKFISLIQLTPKLKEAFTNCFFSYTSFIGDDNKPKLIRKGLQTTNFAVGSLSIWKGYKVKYLQWNEFWHKTKTAGDSFRGQKRWNNPGARYWRKVQISKVSNARKWATRATKIGGVLLLADIACTGEIKPSHAINATMLGISTTGIGSIIAGYS